MRRKSIGLMLAAFAILVGSVVNADDEKIAKHLYNKLSEAKQQGSLKNFTLDLEVKDGVVFFSGRVTDKTQKVMVLTLAQKAQPLGVVEIRDGIAVAPKPVAAKPVAPKPVAPKPVAPKPVAPKPVAAKPLAAKPIAAKPIAAKQVATQPVNNEPSSETSTRVKRASASTPVQDFDYLSTRAPKPAPPTQVAAPAAVPVQQVVPAPIPEPAIQTAALPERLAVPANYGNAPVPVQAQMQAPRYLPAAGTGAAPAGARYDEPGLPAYAWPSYAAHPNYGAVTYPKTYSPTAWPYIGPFYPYPQVPLGWRKVTLEWDDGWWYLDFNDNKSRRRRR